MVNGWFDSSKSKLAKDAVRRAIEGQPAGEYAGSFSCYKDDNGEVYIKHFGAWKIEKGIENVGNVLG